MRTEDDLCAALQSLERHAPDLAAVLPRTTAPAPARGRPRRVRERRWLRTVGPIAAAFAVVAAVVTPLTVGNLLKHDLANGPGGSAAVNPTAAAALTAAAAAAAAQPAQSARYFRVSGYVGSTAASGPNAHPYIIDDRTNLTTTWYSSSANANRSVIYDNRAEASVLPTPGALAAWRAAGQPVLPHAATGGLVTFLPYPASSMLAGDFGAPYFADQTLTAAQYLALPTNPAALHSAIRAAMQHPPANTVSGTQPVPKPGSAAENQQVFMTCIALLERDPVTSAVRAAALDILATLPGLTFDENVTDRLGRTGFGISMPGVDLAPSGVVWGDGIPEGTDMKTWPRLRLVISPAGVLLDEEYVTTAPTVSSLRVMPPSGAIPGPAKCPAGWDAHDAGRHRTACVVRGEVLHADGGGAFDVSIPNSASDRTPIVLNEPIIAVPAGTVLSYRAILGAGWTNDTPSAAAPAQGLPGS